MMLWFLFTERLQRLRRFAKLASVILIVFLFIFFLPVSDWLQESSIKLQWHNYDVLDYANSIYGNVVVAKRQEQYTFFLDGLPTITSPHPDIIFVQEFARLPMLFHPQPQNILIISGGAGGLINEILKSPGLSRIDYVELDPLILRMLRIYPTELIERELSDNRVNVLHLDGRFFIKNTDSKYDLIFLGLKLPSDLQTNRLFTEEFFKETKDKLNPGGILTFTLPGSLTYLTKELKDLNACILNSLSNIYPYARVIPGDFNIFLASDSPDILKVDSHVIIQRTRQRNFTSDLLLPGYIEYRLHPRWTGWFNDSLMDATDRGNNDFVAFALFNALGHWNAQFSPTWQRVFLILERVNLNNILTLIIIPFLLSLFFFRGQRRFRLVLPYAIVSSGFFGMLVNLIIIFSFQIIYGYLYHQITMLITLFMVGAALGSISISRYLERIRQPLKLFVALEIGIILWIFIVIYIILSYPLHLVFFILCAVTGLWVGMEFPLANKIYLRRQGRIGTTVGVIYAADLLGGWFAAVLSGILFLPILGLINTCVVILILKMISLIFLLSAVPSILKYLKR